MVTHITYKPHYCDKRYGEYVADKIYHMKLFGISRGLPIASTLLIGKLNSFFIPLDSKYLCNGGFELYPVYYKKVRAKTVTMVKELSFWQLHRLPKYKQKYVKKVFSINTGIITDTNLMKFYIEKYIDVPIEIVNPFCAQPFLENKAKLNKKNIIFIGSFESPTKGYGKLLESFKLLKREDGGWKLYMVGKRGKDFVKGRVKGAVITNHVQSLKPYLAECSICVHPADFEPFGVSVLDAMSAGLIPVVTRMTGISEVLAKNNLSNLVIENNSPETIKEKIEEVYNFSAAKKKKISSRCKKIVVKNYMEEKGLEDFKKAFNRLVE